MFVPTTRLRVQNGRSACEPIASRTRSRTRLVTAVVARWTVEGVFEAIKKACTKATNAIECAKLKEAVPKARIAGGLPKPAPATFQRLSSNVAVLLDPKNDRLLYLVGAGIEESSSADPLVEQLRALLRTAAAPYVHLMALPSRLRTALLREFPGGRPIITQVPLPAHLAHAWEPERSEPPRRQHGGVLELLYGNTTQSSDTLSNSGDGSFGVEAPTDVPDEVLSRRKKVASLKPWLKGVSTRVAQRRDSFKSYKYDELISEFNVLGPMTGFLMAPGVLFVRNNIADNLETDVTADLSFPGLSDPDSIASAAMDDDEEEEDSDDEDMGDGSSATFELTEENMREIKELLQALGIDNDDSDTDDDEEGQGRSGATGSTSSPGSQDDDVKILSFGLNKDLEEQLAEAMADPDDTPFNMEVPLMEGPLGWRIMLQVRPEPTAEDPVAARRAGRAGGDDVPARSLEEALQAEVEYLTNMQRLDAIWHKQALTAGAAPGHDNDRDFEPQPSATSRPGPRDRAHPASGLPAPTAGRDDGGKGEEPTAHLLDRSDGLEADWLLAERLAAARGKAPGRAQQAPGGGAGTAGKAESGARVWGAGWGVPGDRQHRPSRRPGAPSAGPEEAAAVPGAAEGGPVGASNPAAKAAALSAGPSSSEAPSAEAGWQGPRVGGAAGPSLSAPEHPSESGDFVASTRLHRGAAGSQSHSEAEQAQDLDEESQGDGEGDVSVSGPDTSGGPAGMRPSGRSRMVRRPRRFLRSGGSPAQQSSPRPGSGGDPGATEPSASAGESVHPDSAAASTSGRNAPGSASGGTADSTNGSVNGGMVAVPAYRYLRQQPSSSVAGSPMGTGSASHQHATGLSKPGRGWLAPHQPGGSSAPATPSAGAGGMGSPSSPPPSSHLPPEASGYHAMDMDQMAQYVLGRQASPEEVQEFARAVAQSSDVEEAFAAAGAAAAPQPLDDSLKLYGWTRPGTRPPTIREVTHRMSGNRRGIVTPRRRRLRIPPRVLKLLGAEPDHGAHAGGRGGDYRSTGGHGAGAGRGFHGESMSVDLGGRSGLAGGPARSGGRLQPPAHRRPARKPSQEALAEAAVRALEEVGELDRQRSEALVSFLRGRRPPGAVGEGAGPAHEERWAGPSFRSRGGLSGLTRGRDAVVVLPQSLLDAVTGAWHQAEERLLHPDILEGRSR